MRSRLARRVRRSPFAFWVVAFAVAGMTAVVVGGLVEEAGSRAAALGSLVAVPVATRPLDDGVVLRNGDVEWRELPQALVPRGAVAGRRATVGRTVVVPMAEGEVVLAEKLAPGRRAGVAALLPRGRRALAVPVGPGTPPVRVGDIVDVLATFDVEIGAVSPAVAPAAPTVSVAVGAKVLDAGKEAITVAVRPSEAPRLAFAIARGTVTLALTTR